MKLSEQRVLTMCEGFPTLQNKHQKLAQGGGGWELVTLKLDNGPICLSPISPSVFKTVPIRCPKFIKAGMML